MFVIYAAPWYATVYLIHAHTFEELEGGNLADCCGEWTGSECAWFVPGTLDPMED